MQNRSFIISDVSHISFEMFNSAIESCVAAVVFTSFAALVAFPSALFMISFKTLLLRCISFWQVSSIDWREIDIQSDELVIWKNIQLSRTYIYLEKNLYTYRK